VLYDFGKMMDRQLNRPDYITQEETHNIHCSKSSKAIDIKIPDKILTNRFSIIFTQKKLYYTLIINTWNSVNMQKIVFMTLLNKFKL
jgi:hypothetical protein